MGLFSKKGEPEKVFIKGNTLICNVCQHDKFSYRESQFNTRLASLFDLDFANKRGHCYVCENCSKVQWFLEKL